MPDDPPFRILVVQAWTSDRDPLQASLRAAGIDATLTRVDFEAALHAALTHERFDVAIFDPTTPGMTRELVEACLQLVGRSIPMIEMRDVTTIGALLLPLLGGRHN